jgi:hypothetical protein
METVKFVAIRWNYQYSETNVMYFLFSLLRNKGLCMFRALLAHPQEVLHKGTWYTSIACMLCQLAAPGLECFVHPEEALHKRHLVYYVRVMLVGFYQDWSGKLQTW